MWLFAERGVDDGLSLPKVSASGVAQWYLEWHTLVYLQYIVE